MPPFHPQQIIHIRSQQMDEAAGQQISTAVTRQSKAVPLNQWACRPLSEKYELGHAIGQGTYGLVYSATSILNPDEKFALKKMENFDEKEDKEGFSFGFPITTLREIKLLQNLSHPNILNIADVVYEKSHRHSHRSPIIYLCLGLMDIDLAHLLRDREYEFTPARIQEITRQILQGLKYLHEKDIAHRDLKPQNILVNVEGNVKVADFGLAKKLSKLSTPRVVTLWYRAPQLFLGMKTYSTNIDIWSLGCMLAEFIIGKPLFQECTIEKEVIERIYQLTGTPDNCQWLQALELDNYQLLKPTFSKDSEIILHLKKLVPQMENQPVLLDLVEKMLRLNPQSRYSASECLNHDFFKMDFPIEEILPVATVEKKRKLDAGQQNLTKRPKHR